ncbi:ATP-binding protein [Corallococcus macrosporus]|uniref:histidine kinase n=1 Tax=Corallococcus macrosporus DSM 14697 TaxID=1189310 RepID=A0A250JLE9_9BACT|nr:ATP-binding protein [Corallococcus macrosporus]ATB44695.1 histidine kinase [Corallococcus macrosporus DSM 14697]
MRGRPVGTEPRSLREQLADVPDSLALLEGLFTHSPVPYAVFTADGHCLLTNPAFLAMFGAAPPPEYSLFKDELLAELGYGKLLLRAVSGERVQTPVFWYDVKDLEHVRAPAEARRIAISCTGFPLVSANGGVTHIAVAYQDMTAELAAREAAQAERRNLLQVFTQAPVAISVLRGYALRYEFANPLLQKLMGGRELNGRTQEEAIPDLSPELLSLHRSVFETGERAIAQECPVTIDYEGAGRVETKFWNIIFEPLRDERGQVDGLVTFASDVTEQVLARQAVESQQKWLEAVLDLMPMPVVMADPASGDLNFSNAAADRLYGGHIPRDVPATAYGEHFHVTDLAGRRLRVDEIPSTRAARGERLDGLEVLWHTAAGQFALSISSETLPAMHGHPSVVVIPFLDITRLKTVEQHLQEAVRARDEFLSVASHELKTPLTSLGLRLQSFARAIQADPASALAQRHGREVEVMRRQMTRLSELVDGLLDVSRISTGRLKLQYEPVDLSALVKEVAARFELEAARAGCTLHVTHAEGLRGAWDRLRLEQVVSNLLSNALKYGAGAPVHVEVAPGGLGARLWVRDRGIGIDPEAHARIFQKFERAVSERNYGGMGLGLYVTRTLVEALGGTIQVDSRPGEGATFRVELPLQPAR